MRPVFALFVGLVFSLAGCDVLFPGEEASDAGQQQHNISSDGGNVDAGPIACVNTFEIDAALPERLSETGLYLDIESKEVHEALWAFTPSFQLWSDDAAKARFIYLPECESIDTSDMDDWSFPVGTRFFKEFKVGEQRIETRLVERTGPGPYDFLYASYLWNDEETEATLASEDGVTAAKGTAHNIPSQASCRRCHGSHEKKGGRPSRALGFSALQLSHSDEGTKLDDLIAGGRLTHPPAAPIQLPGDDVVRAALGYLHANCGTCHNGTSDGVPQTDMNLWFDVDETNLEDTSAYRTAVGKDNKIFNDQHVTARVEPGVPETSSIVYRMEQRGNNAQMPPLATHTVDEEGLALVRAWILSLP